MVGLNMKYLIIVDMQNDFVDGALGTADAQAIVPAVCDRIQKFDGEIIITQDTHGGDYLDTQEGKNLSVPHCIRGTHGWELNEMVHDAVKTNDIRTVRYITKDTFGSAELAWSLCDQGMSTDIEEIILVGLCTDICVVSNALLLKAFMPEVKITVDASCCAGVTPESHAAALKTMQMCQVNVENWEG